ncbi:energy-coupling factor transporter ATPase [Alkalicoccobacillus murimartini]|uniref:Energy-coupling factor transport system ATP-binding protein n=1 Tax=Alkalicoccobacillus murimartini TaxID=171685 RepID=A0ABT9YP97_9BACI|nr:energy-coupling factor transporter ATPase [Alkalicoccobacillus murimartini]MDQ0209296.1 energy-coupling factor transport system ATP-binding protein [Alkalicoccobacillus murimartini]
MTVLIDIQDVSFQYPHSSKSVLTDVSIRIKRGEWVAIAGRNGSGKSTLGRLVTGQLQPTSGSILLAGDQIDSSASDRIGRMRCGYVFQNPDHQFIGATVWDDLAFGLENYAIPREEMLSRMRKYVAVLDLEDLIDQAPHQLSGGQKQRVALAGVMVLEPDVIILDEATSMLDPKGRTEVMNALAEISRRGVTIVMITHDMEEVMQTERLIIVHEGQLVADDHPFKVFEEDHLIQEAGLKRPFVVELQQELGKADLPLHGQCRTEGELIKQLCSFPLNK